MQITPRIHALKIPFKVPLSAEKSLDRFAFVYLLFGDSIHLIDSGVAGAAGAIWDYIKQQGRDPQEVSSLILTHSHPDHLGAAKSLKAQTGCTIFAHKNEQDWIEDTEKQYQDRPVPGFHTLVEGAVEVDVLVEDGELLELEKDLRCQIIHTPGHSRGSISLFFEEESALFTGDTLILPGDLPIYEDISQCFASIKRLQKIQNLDCLFSSWEPPMQGRQPIRQRMDESLSYLDRIHAAVINSSQGAEGQSGMELCQKAVAELGLPPFAAMPLVARAFESSLKMR